MSLMIHKSFYMKLYIELNGFDNPRRRYIFSNFIENPTVVTLRF